MIVFVMLLIKQIFSTVLIIANLILMLVYAIVIINIKIANHISINASVNKKMGVDVNHFIRILKYVFVFMVNNVTQFLTNVFANRVIPVE